MVKKLKFVMPTRNQASPYPNKIRRLRLSQCSFSKRASEMTAISFSFLLDVHDDQTQVTKLFNNITDYWQKK